MAAVIKSNYDRRLSPFWCGRIGYVFCKDKPVTNFDLEESNIAPKKPKWKDSKSLYAREEKNYKRKILPMKKKEKN